MSKTIQQKMHEQHEQWRRDYETWLADIDQWRKELQVGLIDIGAVDEALRRSRAAIDDHANTIWENQQRLMGHELVLSEEARLGSSKTDKEWKAAHKEQSSGHVRLIDVHERIKRHQHEVTAEVTRLLKKVLEAL